MPHKHDGVPVEQGLAALVSAGVLLLAGVLLWQVPGVAIRPDHSPRSELRWVWQPPAAPPQVRAPAMPHTDPQPAVPAPVACRCGGVAACDRASNPAAVCVTVAHRGA